MFKTKEQIEKMSHDLDWAGNELFLQEGEIKNLTKELQEKDEEIRASEKREKELSERLVSLLKDYKEKDEEVAKLKKIICKCDTSVGFICESCHEQMNWQKYQEAVNDIDYLVSYGRAKSNYSTREYNFEVSQIRTKYGLNKEEK